ncbi:hypothetical protein GGI04_000832 [Coemansia thaxteri]|nr:hypothetical protein GGI04_000832 [Coemansia thaxteri]KAJ2473588.1 hypothetical protein GGI02_000738 [Coemansia sp. RSA 2322]
MNRHYRSATVGGDGSDEAAASREVPEALFKPGSPLARGRVNRRRSTLHSILERARKKQELRAQQTESKPLDGYSIDAAATAVQGGTISGGPSPALSHVAPPTEADAAPVRAVLKAELQFRRPSAPAEMPAERARRSSPMQKRAEQSQRLLSASPKGSRDSIDKFGPSSRGSADRLGGLMQPAALKRSAHNPFRVERTYRIADRSRDSDADATQLSDKDIDDVSPTPSPLTAAFPMPPVQMPPPPLDLPPLPPQLQKQLKQLPRLSPPRKLPLANVPSLKLGLPETPLLGALASPSGMPQSANRRVVSGSMILRSPSKASFADAQPSQNMHILGPNPPGSAKPGGKGPTTEVFRRVGYWLYSTAPVQFIKQAMVEERNDSVTVLFPTDKSIWILGVSYRLKKNAKNVILPAAIEADSTHLQMDSSLFLSHHHQKRSTSPSRAHHPRSKPDAAASQRRTEEVGNRRRANTSGAMLNKKHLQGISQLQNYPGLPPIPDAGGGHAAGTAAATTAAAAAALSAKHGMRGLASIPSQDLLRPKLAGPTPISPMPFPDEPAIPIESGRLGHNTDVGPDLDSCSISSGVRQTILAQQPHLLAEERPKSSRMNRLRSWVARTANPMRRKSDVMGESPICAPLSQPGKDCSSSVNSSVPAPAAARSRPTSPESQLTAGVLLQPPPSRKSSEAPRSSVMALGLKGAARSSSSTSVGSGSEPRSLGLALPGAASRLRRKSRETLTTLSSSHTAADGQRRSWFDMDVGSHGSLPPVPSIPESASIPATANPSNAAAAAPGSGLPAHGALLPPRPIAANLAMQRRPRSSHSNAAVSQRRLGSSAAAASVMLGPSRAESAVRLLVSDFAAWESPAASIMMFQREWKLPSFQQLVSVQSATAWAKDCGWTVTLSSETFFMAYIFFNLPREPVAAQGPSVGEKAAGDRLLLRMRLGMEDFEGTAAAGDAWRDAITAIILTIDARVAPKCPLDSTETPASAPVDDMSREDHVKRMRVLEKHLARVTELFSQHFWPRHEDLQHPLFNTYPRRRADETGGAVVVERRPNRRARGWGMIPTLLTFKSSEPGLASDPPDSPTLSTFTRKRHLYPMGLSIGAGSNSPPHDLSPIGSVADLPDECRLQEIASCSVSRASSLAPTSSPPKSPVLSARSISPGHERCPAQTQPSGASGVSAAGRPRSSALKRGGLGLYNSNNSDNVSTLADEFGQSLNIISRPPLQSASSQSSGASSGFNANSCANSALRQLPPSATIAAVSVTASNSRQRKRKAGEAGVVGKTKGGFEVVWSATDSMSTSYVMVPVPKTVAPESPAKMHKPQHKPHSRLAAIDGDSIGSHSQPNLKRVLESITREINLDSSYVLLLPPPPPPVAALGADGDQLDGDSADDEFGYLTTTVLRRVKSEIVMRRTLQEFEHEYGLDRATAGNSDSDSFQMVDASDDDASSRNSVYFSAEDDSVVEHETWYKRLSAASSQHHMPLVRQLEHDAAPYRPHPLSLNQLTLLEFFLDGMRRFYFTYRKAFPTITPSFYTSDMGWGCTYRTCQMMLAESFARVLLSRFWDPFRMSVAERARHGRIIDWFHDADAPKAYYSIHRMARTATEMDKRIGDWLGPSIAAHVMKRLSNKHPSCPLSIHVAIDQTVYASEVRKQGLSHHEEGAERPTWRPLLLLVPVRLGLSRLNLGYIPKIKTLFQIPQSVGLVGGKPSRSFYFIGRQGDNLFYLDPHVTRQHMPRSGALGTSSGGGGDSDSESDASDFEMFGIPEVDEYHTTHVCSMPIHRLDPSMLLGFLFNTEAEWDTFVMAATDKESQRSICTGSSPLFTLLSGSSMMTPQFESMVQPIPGQITKIAAVPEPGAAASGDGRPSPRVNSDPQVKSPRQEHMPESLQLDAPPMLHPPPPLTRIRSASSPRFTTSDVASGALLSANSGGGVSALAIDDDEFEML